MLDCPADRSLFTFCRHLYRPPSLSLPSHTTHTYVPNSNNPLGTFCSSQHISTPQFHCLLPLLNIGYEVTPALISTTSPHTCLYCKPRTANMFDVSWSDPASETVAQHRQRKEREDSKNPQTGRRSSLKSSSTGSSSSSSRTQVPVRSGWGLFGGLSTTKKSSSTSKSSATSKSSDSSRSKTPSISKSQPTPAAVSSYDDRANNESRNTVRDRGRDRDMINEYVGSSRQSVAETVQSSAPSTAGENFQT